jgi:hypothetical protein
VIDVHHTSGNGLDEREDQLLVVEIVLDVALLRLKDC